MPEQSQVHQRKLPNTRYPASSGLMCDYFGKSGGLVLRVIKKADTLTLAKVFGEHPTKIKINWFFNHGGRIITLDIVNLSSNGPNSISILTVPPSFQDTWEESPAIYVPFPNSALQALERFFAGIENFQHYEHLLDLGHKLSSELMSNLRRKRVYPLPNPKPWQSPLPNLWYDKEAKIIVGAAGNLRPRITAISSLELKISYEARKRPYETPTSEAEEKHL